MSAKRKRPERSTDCEERKGAGSGPSPRDQREGAGLQFVLIHAPPDTEWEKVAEVYAKQKDPREVWPDE